MANASAHEWPNANKSQLEPQSAFYAAEANLAGLDKYEKWKQLPTKAMANKPSAAGEPAKASSTGIIAV